MSKRPKKLLDQVCTERGTPSRPEPSVLGPEDQGPAEGLSKYLRVRFSRIRLFPRLYPNGGAYANAKRPVFFTSTGGRKMRGGVLSLALVGL